MRNDINDRNDRNEKMTKMRNDRNDINEYHHPIVYTSKNKWKISQNGSLNILFNKFSIESDKNSL